MPGSVILSTAEKALKRGGFRVPRGQNTIRRGGRVREPMARRGMCPHLPAIPSSAGFHAKTLQPSSRRQVPAPRELRCTGEEHGRSQRGATGVSHHGAGEQPPDPAAAPPSRSDMQRQNAKLNAELKHYC